MVIAGPVFTEWYWGPIFFAVVFGPPLSLVALLVDFGVRRWVRPLRWRGRVALWAAVMAAGTVAIVGGRALVEHVRFARDAQAAARRFAFTPHTPRRLPAGFATALVRAYALPEPVLIARYDVEPAGVVLAYQQRAGAPLLTDGHCELHGLAGSGTNFFDGPCRARRTPGGREVFIGAREAFTTLGHTLVRLQHSGVREPALLAWFDALRPVAPGDLDFKRG
jgi:hypothetical protein